MSYVETVHANCPVILSMPHSGTFIPDDLQDCLNSTGNKLGDTDWFIDQLYEGLLPDAGRIKAVFHRYVIDANRDPENRSLYQGQNTTDLCPLTDFEGQPVYLPGREPSAGEIQRRLVEFHRPYHDAIQGELERVRDKYGFAVLYDCHSIRSELPFLFPGVLPDFNIGTNDDRSCTPELSGAILDCCRQYETYSSVLNGRFKGGWTTRHYGDPESGIYAIQMELAQSTYMSEADNPEYVDELAQQLRRPLKAVLELIENYFK